MELFIIITIIGFSIICKMQYDNYCKELQKEEIKIDDINFKR